MYNFVIIGGGIHGVHIAISLIEKNIATIDQLRIIDPSTGLLANWQERTKRVGMSHLRSPSVHNLAIDPMDLLKSKKNAKRKRRLNLFASPYARPSLDLFNHHCEQLIAQIHLKEAHLQDVVLKISTNDSEVSVETRSGKKIHCKNIIFAIGNGHNSLNIPAWALANIENGTSGIQHIFGETFTSTFQNKDSIAVVGGGMTAAQRHDCSSICY